MITRTMFYRSPEGGEGEGGDPPGNDPNTPAQLKRARDDAKRHREDAERLRGEVETKHKEAEGLRGKLTQVQKDAETNLAAKLEELRTDLTGKLTAAETKAQEAEAKALERSTMADLRIAAKDAGMVDLDGLKLLDRAKVKLTDAGDVENGADLMAQLKKDKPYLFGGNSSSNPQKPPKPDDGKAKKYKDMTPEERDSFDRQNKIRS